MSDLNNFWDGLNEASKQKANEREEFNRRLGEPAVFLPYDPEDQRFGIGLWKADKGVVAYAKFANGFDPYSRIEYTNELIETLQRIAKS